MLTLIASYIPPRPEWMDDAACIETPLVDFFPGRGERTAPALAVCARCLVVNECRSYALEHDLEDGIYGGTTGLERRRIRATNTRTERRSDATP